MVPREMVWIRRGPNVPWSVSGVQLFASILKHAASGYSDNASTMEPSACSSASRGLSWPSTTSRTASFGSLEALAIYPKRTEWTLLHLTMTAHLPEIVFALVGRIYETLLKTVGSQ